MSAKNKPAGIDFLNKERNLAFQRIKEHRGKYFVRYEPARAGDYFASLVLIFLEPTEPSKVAERMEQECADWFQRYPVPLMVTSFDDTDTMISLNAERGCDHLTVIPRGGKIDYHWRLLKNEEFPSGPLPEDQLLSVYYDIPFSTLEERQKRATLDAKYFRLGMRIIKWSMAIRVVAGAVFEALLGTTSTIYSIGRAILQALKMLGYVKKSEHERKREENELRIRHHHYHCEQNPEEFMKLKVKNFTRLSREEIHAEAEEIKMSQAALLKGSK